MDFQDLDWQDGSDNTPGIGQYIYQAKISDIETLPKPIQPNSAGSGTFSDLATISDNIVMKAGKSFKKIYVTLEAGSLTSNSQGDLDGMSFLNMLKFFHPGSHAAALGYAQWAKNGSSIFLVPEQDGNVRMVGTELYPCKMESAEITTGEKSADRKGNTYTFRSAAKGPAPIFTGKITVSGVGSEVDSDSDGFQDVYYAD